MSIIEQIKAEIERLKKNSELAKMEWVNEGYNQNAFAEDCRIKSFDTLLSFLDTLESENSVPNDRDEAAKEYAKTTFKKPHSDNPDEEVTIVEPDKYAGFIAGAKWMAEQMKEDSHE